MKEIRAMFIGAHPDDCDIRCGGLALKYARAGHKVKFLSLCNGNGGHYSLSPDALAKRRRGESLAVAKFAGLEYDVWEDSDDCMIVADLAARARLVRAIREFAPDILFSCRTNDYHADHRNAAILVQDASYLLTVPHYCPDAPAMRKMPTIMHYYDQFQNPVFKPTVVIRTDDVLDAKIEMLSFHESQMFEWLAYEKGLLDKVPEGREERIAWLHEPRVDRTKPFDLSLIQTNKTGMQYEYREARPAALYKDKLIERYGAEGEKVLFAEAYSICEYGSPYNDELIPF